VLFQLEVKVLIMVRNNKRRVSQFVVMLIAGLVILISPIVSSENGNFDEWLSRIWNEALTRGISESTLDTALSGLRPIPKVIELDRHQPEFQKSLQNYINRQVSEKRIRRGRELLREHAGLLDAIYRQYGVPPRYLVALWGVETNYGEILGSFPVIGALATLAHDVRRPDYFRKELFNALTIIDEESINAQTFRGSWSGATGQLQFMPSTYLRFAVDGDGDGRRDIWKNLPDIFASAANYLVYSGWKEGYKWGRRVQLIDGFNGVLPGLETQLPLKEWQTMGVRGVDGLSLPSVNLTASLILPEGRSGPAYLVYPNYRAILRWNRSHLFALSVCQLADRLIEVDPF
jgi:membrane-bound lytic murein transglycosylase B